MISIDDPKKGNSDTWRPVWEKKERVHHFHQARSHPDEEDRLVPHRKALEEIEDPRFSSSFSVVFLNFFHHDTNSRLEGGDIAACVNSGVAVPRGGI